MEETLEHWQEQKQQREDDIALERQRDDEDSVIMKMLLIRLQEADDKIIQLTDGV